MSKDARRLAGELSRKYPREYKRWQMMRARCQNKNLEYYKYYGGRGIKVCDRWSEKNVGFKNFLEDMGLRPDGASLDRIDPEKSYTPENCRWSGRTVQSYNRRPMDHSTKTTGITKFHRRGKDGFMGHIGKERQHWQKTFNNLYDAVLWRAKKERELYGLEHMQEEKIIVLINDTLEERLGRSVDKRLVEEVIK